MIKTEDSRNTREEKRAYSQLAREFSLLPDEPLEKYTAFRIGGIADLLALPENKKEFIALMQKARELSIPVTLFGGGTNLLISDNGIKGLVILTRHLTSGFQIIHQSPEKTIVSADSGEKLSHLCLFAANHSLSGLEFAAGIPGTTGGAVMMNAGAYSGEMAHVVESIEVLDQNTLEIIWISRKDLNFSYRKLDETRIILSVNLGLTRGDQQEIKKSIKHNFGKKTTTQPIGLKSAGCFFKNPKNGPSAGELIDKSGLKGARVNGAMVSEQHANFIVNYHKATCEDVLLLKAHIQETVFQKFGVRLEPEVRMEGD